MNPGTKAHNHGFRIRAYHFTSSQVNSLGTAISDFLAPGGSIYEIEEVCEVKYSSHYSKRNGDVYSALVMVRVKA